MYYLSSCRGILMIGFSAHKYNVSSKMKDKFCLYIFDGLFQDFIKALSYNQLLPTPIIYSLYLPS